MIQTSFPAGFRTLLPAGLRDSLPPAADHSFEITGRILKAFSHHGYQRIKPPLMEFTDTLLGNAGPERIAQTFRVMDPLSQRMMAVRSDMTPQVARIARTRMAGSPRPLRLSYAGEVLRVQSSQVRPNRQFEQVGIELIGPDSPDADAEVLILIAEALCTLGIPDVSVDLALPTLVPSLLDSLGLDADDSLRDGLSLKDDGAVLAAGGSAGRVLSTLLSAVGPADRGLDILSGLPLPPSAVAVCDRLTAVIHRVREALPTLSLTLDPVENRGFEYHTGLAFTVFSRAVSGELGRGGRYCALNEEPAVGATLFMDSVLTALSNAPEGRAVYLPYGSNRAEAQALRNQGWVTVAGLDPAPNPVAEARRMGCSHWLSGRGVTAVDSEFSEEDS